nr:pyruvate dehydrogenase complex dihydrolipoamide acetyltransferase [Acinetobacter sp. Marseille-Q1620]
MSKLLYMPEILANTTHATINKWLVKAGDHIAAGQAIAEVETDKAVIELTAEEDAIISQLMINEGIEVEVGTAIAQLNGDGNEVLTTAAQPEIIQEIKNTQNSVQQLTENKEQSTYTKKSRRIFASPLAKRLAKQKQLDLTTLSGSGPRGRIVKRDIEIALSNHTTQQAESYSDPLSMDIRDNPVAYDEIPLSSMRKTIARRLTESKTNVPHFYLNVECQVDALLELRQQINAVSDEKISVNDIVVKAVALALQQVPEMNARWAETAIHQYHNVDISIAVATEKGLITPVLKNAEIKSLSVIHSEITELAELARDGKLSPDQYLGGSFSISNLGMYGVSDFNAIINPPQSGILAVGTIQKKPVVVDDNIQITSVMRCSLSVDHRIVDGAIAAQWLKTFQTLIEQPLKLLI